MKATIKRPDGTTISVDDATAEDIQKLAGVTTGGAPHVCAPCLLPHFPLQPFVGPSLPWYDPTQPYRLAPSPMIAPGVPFRCVIPWTAIWGMKQGGAVQLWGESMPEQALEEMQLQEQKLAPRTGRHLKLVQ